MSKQQGEISVPVVAGIVFGVALLLIVGNAFALARGPHWFPTSFPIGGFLCGFGAVVVAQNRVPKRPGLIHWVASLIGAAAGLAANGLLAD